MAYRCVTIARGEVSSGIQLREPDEMADHPLLNYLFRTDFDLALVGKKIDSANLISNTRKRNVLYQIDGPMTGPELLVFAPRGLFRVRMEQCRWSLLALLAPSGEYHCVRCGEILQDRGEDGFWPQAGRRFYLHSSTSSAPAIRPDSMSIFALLERGDVVVESDSGTLYHHDGQALVRRGDRMNRYSTCIRGATHLAGHFWVLGGPPPATRRK